MLVRRTVIVLVALAAVVGSACNSTTRTHDTVARAGGSPGSQSLTGVTDVTTAETPGAAASGTGSSGAAPRRGAAASGGAASTSPAKTAGRASTSAGDLLIGIEIPESRDAAATQFGLKGIDDIDEQGWATGVVEYINLTGGLAGHKVVPLFHTAAYTSGNWNAESQKTCAAFTEDNHVFAVTTATLGTEVLAACLQPRHIPMISQQGWVYDRQLMLKYGDIMFLPGSMDTTRVALNYVDGLVAQSFFTPTSKIGLLRVDGPAYDRVIDGTLKPRLAARGLHLTEEAHFTELEGTASVSGMSAQASNAVLRFRSAGIDRVITLDFAGLTNFLFMPVAESQGYHPRYGFHSLMQPEFTRANVPAAQMEGMVGVGWRPNYDTGHAEGLSGPNYDWCVTALQKRKGYAPGEGTSYCDQFLFLRAALDHAPRLTPEGIRAGAEAIGAMSSAVTFGARFGPGRHDGTDGIRYFSYVDSCACIRYMTGIMPAKA